MRKLRLIRNRKKNNSSIRIVKKKLLDNLWYIPIIFGVIILYLVIQLAVISNFSLWATEKRWLSYFISGCTIYIILCQFKVFTKFRIKDFFGIILITGFPLTWLFLWLNIFLINTIPQKYTVKIIDRWNAKGGVYCEFEYKGFAKSLFISNKAEANTYANLNIYVIQGRFDIDYVTKWEIDK